MQLAIEIDLENEAFRVEPCCAVSYVLSQVTRDLMERRTVPISYKRALTDPSGNTVGRAQVVIAPSQKQQER